MTQDCPSQLHEPSAPSVLILGRRHRPHEVSGTGFVVRADPSQCTRERCPRLHSRLQPWHDQPSLGTGIGLASPDADHGAAHPRPLPSSAAWRWWAMTSVTNPSRTPTAVPGATGSGWWLLKSPFH